MEYFVTRGPLKEYILVREQTAPPPRVFKTSAHQTSPYSVGSILQRPDCLTEQARVGWANKTQGGAVPSITDIYSLGLYTVLKLRRYQPRHLG